MWLLSSLRNADFSVKKDQDPIALFAIAAMFLKTGWPSYLGRSK